MNYPQSPGLASLRDSLNLNGSITGRVSCTAENTSSPPKSSGINMTLTALDLLRQLRGMVPNLETQQQIDAVIAAEDVVEGVGAHQVGSIVTFKPAMDNTYLQRAKVLRNRGTATGKVLYDLALEVTEMGKTDFYTTDPLRAVDSIFVGSLFTPADQAVQTATEQVSV